MIKVSKLQDLTGMTFNRLTVLERAEKAKDGKTRWLCRCSCGNLCVVLACHLKAGKIKSCGCWNSEQASQRFTIHGMSETKVFRRWKGMRERCRDPKHKGFSHYGGRGIKVCERWQNFQNFYDDVSKMEHFGENDYSLDRIDNDGDYCPENVRWASTKEQASNKSTNTKMEYNG